MKKLLTFLDQHLLLILTGILMVVIPAYPKLPLADLIEGYIVRLRIEDLMVLVTTLIWFVQLLRRKITFPKPVLAKWIIGYLVVGLLSTLSAIFITETVPMAREHIFKLYLHYFRRIEYFSLFFIAYSSIRSKRDLKILLAIALATLVAVVLYGFGQKYLLWPAFSTMNREFSKGVRLYLSPSSRVMSTFAGHYDYAAYLMMALSFVVAGFWLVKKWYLKLMLVLIFAGAYWSLILTASRTSFLGYLAGITVIAWMLGKSRGRLKMFFNWLAAVVVSMFVMLTMGDLSERFFSMMRQPDQLAHDLTQILPVDRRFVNNIMSAIGFQVSNFEDSLIALKSDLNKPVKSPPPGGVSDDPLGAVSTPTDTPPTSRPPDVSEEEEALRRQLEAAQTSTPTGNGEYSPNALKYGLSIAIRLDALWPRAIEGFKRNPLLGSGYSTLVKAENEEFTQAESTDNDYLRMLGETGILGTITFLAAVALLTITGYRLFQKVNDPLWQTLGAGIVGAVIALLVNATYIDVFESSKIAYLLWAFAAITLRALELTKGKSHAQKAA